MTELYDPIDIISKRIYARFAPPEPPPPRRWETPGVLARVLDPNTVQTPALDVIDRELVRLMDEPGGRLIISMPPQEGKSVRVSHRFPEWILTHNPDLRIAIISYTDEMARRHGAEIKLDVENFDGLDSTIDLGLRLRPDSKAAGRWNIDGHKGSVYCTGVGGSLTGKPVDVMIIDDPIKNMEQAQSQVYRDKLKDFWRAVCIPRLGDPNAKCVIIQTRWNDDDLAGWLQINEPGQWRVVNISAQAESEDDPLGRKPGEYMISARGARNWEQIKTNVGSFVWAALYQGHPSPVAGGLFKRAHLRYWIKTLRNPQRHGLMRGARIDLGGRMVELDDCWRFLTVDLAASTKTSADWTVAGVWAISPDGDLILLDGDRKRIEEDSHWNLVRPLREKWAADVVFVESSMIKSTLVYEAGKVHVPVQELKADTDKVTRALPATVRAETGRLWLPSVAEMPEVGTWVNELVSFPNAAHDDIVDVVSYAARVHAAHWLGQRDSESITKGLPSLPTKPDEISKAYQSATGTAPNGMDYETLRWD
jgi:predicted phage terminase large subunit-like protein